MKARSTQGTQGAIARLDSESACLFLGMKVLDELRVLARLARRRHDRLEEVESGSDGAAQPGD